MNNADKLPLPKTRQSREANLDILVQAITDVATEQKRFPLIGEVVDRSSELRGIRLTSGWLYKIIGNKGNPALRTLGAEHGVYEAVVVNGTVLVNDQHSEAPVLIDNKEKLEPAYELKDIPTGDLFSLMSRISEELNNRNEQV